MPHGYPEISQSSTVEHRRRFSSLQLVQEHHVANPEFSLAVRIKNEAPHLPHFLRSIQRQKFDGAVEIVFLDSGSTDGSLEYLRTQECTVYRIAAEDFSFGSSCNLLMELTHAPYVFFLSGHVELVRENIFSEVRAQVALGECAIVLRQVPNDRIGSSAYERAYLARTFRDGARPIALSRSRLFFSNAASVVPRAGWEALRFPDVLASEDFLWAREYLRRGPIYYLPSCGVRHSHNESPEAVHQRVAINVRARYGRLVSPLRAAYYFAGVFLTTCRHGGSTPEAASYARAHSAAYLRQ